MNPLVSEPSSSDERSPRISVIIPCHNLGQYLDEAVDSVLAQTYQDFEILIVDDGSTDAFTQTLLDDYTRPKTTVFRTPNRKLAAARNFLIGHARGTYLCALDADDKLHPEYFEKTVAILDRDDTITFVSTHLQMFGAEQRVWPDEARSDLPDLLCDDTLITPTLVRRAAVVGVGGYDERMPHQGDEDWDLWISLVKAGHRGVILPDILFFYRRRPGSMCDECTRGQVHLDLIQYLLRKHGESYRVHLLHVLRWKSAQLHQLVRENDDFRRDEARNLAAVVALRETELNRLKARRAETQGPNTSCDTSSTTEAMVSREDYQRALAEIADLRTSMSWTLTAPLRALYDALVGGRRGGAS